MAAIAGLRSVESGGDSRTRDPGRAAPAGRPVRLRPVEGPTRTARRTRVDRLVLPRHVAPAGRGEERRTAGPRRPGDDVRPAGRLRGRARQRWGDRVLGHRDVLPDRTAFAAPDVR